jgi:hypothetical protein
MGGPVVNDGLKHPSANPNITVIETVAAQLNNVINQWVKTAKSEATTMKLPSSFEPSA